MPTPLDIDALLAPFPRVSFVPWQTPLESQPRLGARLGISLWIKRDDLTGIGFGGNKLRKLEFYLGQALHEGANVALVTGAVQSNYVRAVAACAARLGLECHVQLEERVPGMDAGYRSSGNVLLDDLFGATRHSYSTGEDEDGADRRLRDIAAVLRDQGKRPFVIPLAPSNPPLGALGYVQCARELLEQTTEPIDYVVVPSGSGLTHSGVLFGLRALGWPGSVIGICVRRPASEQRPRVERHCEGIATLLGVESPVRPGDVEVHDDSLAPGYGLMSPALAEAIDMAARTEGLLLDPVYTARCMAGMLARVRDGRIAGGSKVVFIHTGGLPALFGYERDLRAAVIAPRTQAS